MIEIPLWRRCSYALVGIGVAGWILRGHMAEALVARGDEFLYRSNPRQALHYYRRAVQANSNDAVALDRYLFDATALHDRPAIGDAIAFANRYLPNHPHDDAIEMDRAMGLRIVGRLAASMDDFARVGLDAKDARALVFAGLQARALGRPANARRFWKRALALDPRFAIARRLLTRMAPKR